jgi:thiosulfate sulfurtransferase
MIEDSNAYKTISVEEANNFIKEDNITIVDIRDENSFSQSHIPKAIHLSNNNIDGFIEDSQREDNILIYCYKGISSQSAAQHFCNLGYKNIYSLEGGYAEYSKKNI